MRTLVYGSKHHRAGQPVKVGDEIVTGYLDSTPSMTMAKSYRVGGWDAEVGQIFLERDGKSKTVFAAGVIDMDWIDPETTAPQYAVAAGFVPTGFRFYGPFPDEDAAHDYMDRLQISDPYSVVALEPPKRGGRVS